MEDIHVVHQPGTWNCNDTQLAFIGVYDGHGGRDIVNFLEECLAKNIADELNHNDVDEITHAPSSHQAMHKRIEQAFLITDIQSRMKGITSSGATVCICLIKRDFYEEQKHIVIHAANIGDARIVLYHPRKECPTTKTTTKHVIRLTKDHRASDPEEVRRIEKAGGFVFRDRVLGILAVSRSIGDHGLKDYVIAHPFQQSIELTLDTNIDQTREDAFIILACDGIWDVFTDEEAVSFLLESLKWNNMQPRKDETYKVTKDNISQILCNEAIRRGSADNVTVLVVWL